MREQPRVTGRGQTAHAGDGDARCGHGGRDLPPRGRRPGRGGLVEVEALISQPGIDLRRLSAGDAITACGSRTGTLREPNPLGDASPRIRHHCDLTLRTFETRQRDRHHFSIEK